MAWPADVEELLRQGNLYEVNGVLHRTSDGQVYRPTAKNAAMFHAQVVASAEERLRVLADRMAQQQMEREILTRELERLNTLPPTPPVSNGRRPPTSHARSPGAPLCPEPIVSQGPAKDAPWPAWAQPRGGRA